KIGSFQRVCRNRTRHHGSFEPFLRHKPEDNLSHAINPEEKSSCHPCHHIPSGCTVSFAPRQSECTARFWLPTQWPNGCPRMDSPGKSTTSILGPAARTRCPSRT